MKKVRIFTVCCFIVTAVFSLFAPPLWSDEKVTHEEFDKYKRFFDDPRPVFTDWSMKKNMPPEDYAKIASDPEAMRALWAEVVGFMAPDVVGKVAPEIKPGKYSYTDKEKYPGLKALMVPAIYERFKPGAPPLAGNFPEMEIVPTRQYPWALKIAQATKDNAGRTKLDEKGYLLGDTYRAGYPFPRPSGQFTAQQYLYNWKKIYNAGEDNYGVMHGNGFSKNLKPDYEVRVLSWNLRLTGRALSASSDGFFDQRARDRGEDTIVRVSYFAPRDRYGDSIVINYYTSADTYDSLYMYIGGLRRIRKLSNTDTQDAVGGSDYCYEDAMGFSQKMSSKRYPYKYEIVEEREYLFPYTLDGSDYITSKGAEWRNLKFERRPVVVLKLTQLDKNFIYSFRIIYIDRETFQILHAEMYDQKGRFYRSYTPVLYYDTGTGLFLVSGQLIADHVDLHSTINRPYTMPTTRVNRNMVDITSLQKTGR